MRARSSVRQHNNKGLYAMRFTLQLLLILVVLGICVLSLTSALHSMISGGIVIGLLSAVIAIAAGCVSVKLIDWSLN